MQSAIHIRGFHICGFKQPQVKDNRRKKNVCALNKYNIFLLLLFPKQYNKRTIYIALGNISNLYIYKYIINYMGEYA